MKRDRNIKNQIQCSVEIKSIKIEIYQKSPYVCFIGPLRKSSFLDEKIDTILS